MNIEQTDAALETPFDLSGKTILVTGVLGGIGSATALVCQNQGANIIPSDILSPERAREKIAGRLDPDAYRQLDISNRSAVEALAKKLGPIWGVIDTAGLCPVDDWMDESWEGAFDKVVDVNMRGPINLARAFMPGMIEQGGGRLIYCGSVSGRMGGVVCGPHYAATKGGVHSLVRWLSQRGTKHGVLVNAVAPGSVDTPMAAQNNIDPDIYPMKRAGRPKELGATLAFLCSPAAGFISGAVIDVNGGTFFS